MILRLKLMYEFYEFLLYFSVQCVIIRAKNLANYKTMLIECISIHKVRELQPRPRRPQIPQPGFDESPDSHVFREPTGAGRAKAII